LLSVDSKLEKSLVPFGASLLLLLLLLPPSPSIIFSFNSVGILSFKNL
jgi:hypothetical protein